MTALDIITTALELLGVNAPGEVPSGADGSRGLSVLNAMIDSWAVDDLIIFSIERTTHTLTPSLNPHTIGATGTFTATRPVGIERAGLIQSGGSTENELDVLTVQQYAAIGNKTQSGVPSGLYYDPAMPNGKLYFDRVPDAAHTLVLYKPAALHSTLPLLLSTTMSLAQGYQRMIEHNLAVELGPYYGTEAPPTVQRIASESKAAIANRNSRTPLLECDSAIVDTGNTDILSLRP